MDVAPIARILRTALCVAFALTVAPGCANQGGAASQPAPRPEVGPGVGLGDGSDQKLDEGPLPDADAAFDLVVEAKAKREAGHHGEALALLDEALATDPGLAVAHLEWAVAGQHVGEAPEQILDHLDRAVTLTPQSARARQVRAAFLLERGDHNGALADAEKALVLRPDLGGTRLLLARIAERDGKPEAARAHYRALLERQPDHVAALIGVATTSEALGDLPTARAALLRVAELQPDVVGHRRRLIAFFTRIGDEQAAAAERAALDKLDPKAERKLRVLKPSKRRGKKRPKRNKKK